MFCTTALKATILSVVLLLPSTFPLADNDQSTSYRILRTGSFHGSEVDSVRAEGWYGLFKSDSGHFLEPVEVTTRPRHDPIVDSPGDTTGIAVSVDHSLSPLLLIQPPHNWESGGVPSIFDGHAPIKPGESTRVGEYILSALGQITDEKRRHPGDLLILGYQVKLYKYPYSEPAQILVEYDRSVYESLTTLLWAGDLDRDGRPDFLLDIRNHYNISHYALFLSSEADPNDHVKLVAELRKGGC